MTTDVTKPSAKPVPTTPYAGPIAGLQREIDRLFDHFNHGFWSNPLGRSLTDWKASFHAPAVDIAEKDNEFEITAEIPGMDEKDIDVSLANGSLIIKGEKKSEKEEKKKNYYLSERHYGSFERQFPLPEGVDRDKIAATFQKGVLTLTLPKTAEARRGKRKIAIKAS